MNPQLKTLAIPKPLQPYFDAVEWVEDRWRITPHVHFVGGGGYGMDTVVHAAIVLRREHLGTAFTLQYQKVEAQVLPDDSYDSFMRRYLLQGLLLAEERFGPYSELMRQAEKEYRKALQQLGQDPSQPLPNLIKPLTHKKLVNLGLGDIASRA